MVAFRMQMQKIMFGQGRGGIKIVFSPVSYKEMMIEDRQQRSTEKIK